MLKINEFISDLFKAAIIVVALLLSSVALVNAQTDKKYIREGNHAYDKSKYPDSEILYRKASDKNKESADAVFNTGDALYKQKKYEEAGKQFESNYSMNEDRKKKSASMYNMGNSLLMANKVKESIEAYKGSLKLNPRNNEAKYNLAYAQDLLKKQEQQQQQQQDQKNQDKKDQDKNKDKNQQDKDQKKNQDKNDQNQDKKDQQQQAQEQNISKEDAQRVLNALANDEKNVQEKVKLAKAAQDRVRTTKNW
jgi:Ca-activated chloride channel homolog